MCGKLCRFDSSTHDDCYPEALAYALAVTAHTLSPTDLIPDFIPALGCVVIL